jgi:hypothetical protein
MPILNNPLASQKSLTSRIVIKNNVFLMTLSYLAITTSTPVYSQQSATGVSIASEASISNSVYQASFFEQYRPQNALEMVQRLPGFNFDKGQNNRGFGGNAGNVLVDGLRPTSKSGGLSGALSRIPAAQVERIEILRGGVAAGEAAGQSVVANVIKKSNVTSGTWAAKLRSAPDGNILPNIEAAIATKLGQWDTAFDFDAGGKPGYREATIEDRDQGAQLESGTKEVFKNTGRWFFSNGQGSKEYQSGTLTLNGRLGADKHDAKANRQIFDQRLPDRTAADEHLIIDETRQSKMAELGLDWLDKGEQWKMHLIGLGLVRDVDYKNQVDYQDFSEPEAFKGNFEQSSLKSELIARATFGYQGNNQFKPEYGFELAQNNLSSDSLYRENGENIELNGANVEVQELRSEVFATFVYPQSHALTIEGGLTGEFSEIKVTGEAANRATFSFLKPRLSSTYKLNEQSQIVITAERSVGQLNFGDFAASNQAQDGNIVSGNPNLAPDKKDQLSTTYDLSFSEKGSLTVKLFHEWRQDILEQIILPSGGYGRGNAGDARFWGVVTDINLPLDFVMENGLLEIAHRYRDSDFQDPIIQKNRSISSYTPLYLGVKLRQDLIDDQWAWGVQYESNSIEEHYRVDERITFEGNDRLHAFIETTRFFGLKMQLEVRQMSTGEFTRSRFLYDGSRGDELLGSEISRRTREPEYKLSVWGTF